MKRFLFILIILAVIGGFGFIAWQQNWFGLRAARDAGKEPKNTTEQPSSTQNDDLSSGVVALGRLEPAAGVVDRDPVTQSGLEDRDTLLNLKCFSGIMKSDLGHGYRLKNSNTSAAWPSGFTFS